MGFNIDNTKKREIALYKRVAEYASMVSGFKEELKADYDNTLKKYGLEEAIGISREAFDEFMNAKVEWRDGLKEKCSPDNSKMKKWRDRQFGRCKMSFPDRAEGNVHIPVVYELSSGCSVGCDFCGVGAKGLQAVYRYNDENAGFFRQILEVSNSIIGEAAKYAGVYFATEPLDNPDIEKFHKMFVNMNGQTPQITTAVPVRDIERTRKLIATLDENSNMFFRFSVRSLDEFNKIMESFTPEELLYVELLPQYSEAPANNFVKAGRSRNEEGIETSISCISGFLVNMCEKTIKLTTPVLPSDEFPEGMAIILNEKFATIEEYEAILKKAISEKMKTILEPDDKLSIYSWFNYSEIDDKVGIISKNGVGILVNSDESAIIYKHIYDALKEGIYTRKELGKIVADKMNILDTTSIFSIINKMWNMGFIEDKSLWW